MGVKTGKLLEIMGYSQIETMMVYTHVDYLRELEGVKWFDLVFKSQ